MAARKKLEDEREHLLAEAENRAAELDTIIYSMASGLVVYNTAGKAIRMNNVAKELLPQDVFFNMTVDERARVLRWETEEGQPFPTEELPVGRALRGETTHSTVMAASFLDRKLWFSASAEPIHTSDGQTLGVVASFTDITERKQTEDALKVSEERLRFALETIHTGAWDLDLLDHSAFRSIDHDRVFGYSQLLPEWTYEMFLEHVLPEDRSMVDDKFQQAMKDKSDWNFECRIKRADGQVRWILAAGQHTHDATGALNRMAGIPIWTPSMKSGLRIPKSNSLWRIRPDGSARPVEEAPPLRALAGEVVKNQEEMVRTPATGEIRYRQVSSNPVRDVGGQIIGSVSVVRDMTEHKKAEDALRESETRFRTMANSIPQLAWIARADGFIFW